LGGKTAAAILIRTQFGFQKLKFAIFVLSKGGQFVQLVWEDFTRRVVPQSRTPRKIVVRHGIRNFETRGTSLGWMIKAFGCKN
jgi:hypothetical protein